MGTLFPLAIIGLMLYAATTQASKKAIEQISVNIKKFKLGFNPKVTLEVNNPSNRKIQVTFVKIAVFYKEKEVATISDYQTRILQPGPNDITLTIRPSLRALEIFTIPKGTPRTIKVTWEVATTIYSVKGEKQTTI